MVVSAYAFSAGISGILAAGFADQFDRKRLLLFFYVGFTWERRCARSRRIIRPAAARAHRDRLFGGVIGSIVLAIITDLFPLQMRGRVMGFVQTAFAASQVLGIPAGLFLANPWNWHVAFRGAGRLIASPVGLVIVLVHEAGVRASRAQAGAKPVGASDRHRRGAENISGVRYDDVAGHRRLHADAVRQRLYGATISASLADLPTIYLVSGLFTIFTGPLVGRASDAFGKYQHVRLRLRDIDRDGADLHPSRSCHR